MIDRENQHIKAVLFDMDDTLIDWSGVQADMATVETKHLGNIHRYLTESGHRLPPFADFWDQFRQTMIDAWTEAKKSWSGVSFAHVIRNFLISLNLNIDEIEMVDVLRAYDWSVIPGVTLFDDTLSVLDQLKKGGYKIGLITNAMQPMWMRDIELSYFGILDYLDARLTSGDVGFMKPHPFIYWRALELLEVEPQAAVFVGDRPANDIVGANEAGLTSVLMAPPHLNRPLNGVRPNYTIARLAELLPILALLEDDSSKKVTYE